MKESFVKLCDIPKDSTTKKNHFDHTVLNVYRQCIVKHGILIITLRGHSILTVFDAVVVKVVILVFDRHFRSENVNILQVFDRVFPDDGSYKPPQAPSPVCNTNYTIADTHAPSAQLS